MSEHKIYGLLARPIIHSISPYLHSLFASYNNINMSYLPLEVKENLELAILGAYELNIKGLNISIPFKQESMQYVSDIDEESSYIGSINTLVLNESKNSKYKYKAYNTDLYGISKTLQENNIFLYQKNIIILGFGGSAKTIFYYCIKEKIKSLNIIARDLKKVKLSLKDSLDRIKNIKFTYIFKENLCSIDFYTYKLQVYIIDENTYHSYLDKKSLYIVFNTTPVGMYPNINDIYIKDREFYDLCDVGIDLIYNPLITPFMNEFIKRNKKAVSGLDMLINQGAKSFELWNNIYPINEENKELIKMKLVEYLENKY